MIFSDQFSKYVKPRLFRLDSGDLDRVISMEELKDAAQVMQRGESHGID